MFCQSITCVLSLALLLLISSVSSQVQAHGQLHPILNVKTIQDKGNFTITCDADRVEFPPTDSDVTNIFSLTIYVNTSTYPMTNVAHYDLSRTFQKKQKNVPTERDWKVSFNPSNKTNNRKSAKIEVLVGDAKCIDAGEYICNVQYIWNNQFQEIDRTHVVTAEAKTTVPDLKYSYPKGGQKGTGNSLEYGLHDNITLTCSVNGPESLVIKWRREIRPTTGSDILFEDYPVENGITKYQTLQSGSGDCAQFQHQSQLKFSVSQDDSYRLYSCVAHVNGEDIFTTSVNITWSGAKPPTVTTTKAVPTTHAVHIAPVAPAAHIPHREPARNGAVSRIQLHGTIQIIACFLILSEKLLGMFPLQISVYLMM